MLRSKARFAAAALALATLAQLALASNPRWVTGPPYFTTWSGLPVQWYTRTPMYYTDPGDLSPYVNHAAADAIVAAAANVWNVPTAEFEIAQGGTLAEHVSSANTIVGGSGVTFPGDVQSSNYQAIQIAVIYDTDGSVTDLLLGQGSSSPIECLQNSVTESVDSITPNGNIQHAVLILNGRCTGPGPEQQLQMQYELQRAFGRVFGLGWSQTNDNVFTHTPVPTYAQAQHWPIMHPIEIVCGPYTYQCLPQPFTLRDDDIASISYLYLQGFSNQFGWTGYTFGIAGKTQSYDNAAHGYGRLSFANGQGMQGVNVVLQRSEMFNAVPEAWYDVSTVSGYLFQQNQWNPVTGAPAGLSMSQGGTDASLEGYFDFGWIPIIAQQGWDNVTLTTEAVNPLYTGSHAVGPYTTGTVSPAGLPTTTFTTGLRPNDAGFFATDLSFTMTGSDAGCRAALDGIETAPAAVPASGFFSGALCARGRNAWFTLGLRTGRTATVEVTALDESGQGTETKARPVLALWNSTDTTGSAPSLGANTQPFNSLALGTTRLNAAGGAGPLRLVVADARGDGRPDFSYSLRVFYADTVAPAGVPPGGGAVTISGMGFRAGNQVFVNGVRALVSSGNANLITAIAPAASVFGRTPGFPVDVTVLDPQTGATTTIAGAISYLATGQDRLALVSAPSGTIAVGSKAATAFAVKVTLGDGVTPVPGMPVVFAAAGGNVQLSGCSGVPCIATTNATGTASIAITPQTYGAITLQAAAVGLIQTVTLTSVLRTIVPVQTTEYVAPGTGVVWTPKLELFENGVPAANLPVHWTGSASLSVSPNDSFSATSGLSQVAATVSPLASGEQATGQACAWVGAEGGTVCTPITVVTVAAPVWRVGVTSGAGQAVAGQISFQPVSIVITDAGGNAVGGVPVTIHQAVTASQMACPDRGACPVPAALSTSQVAAVTDASGSVSFQPLQVAGVPEVTNIAVTSGTQGFVSLSLTQGP